MQAFGKTLVLHQPLDRHVFHSDHLKAPNDAAAVLMGEVALSPGEALMHASDDLASCCSFRCSPRFVRATTLHSGKRWFLFAEDLGIGNRVASRPGGECLEPYVKAHALLRSGQGRWLSARAGKRDRPLARAAALKGRRLGCAFRWTMPDDLHLPAVHEAQAPGVRIHLTPHGHLRAGAAVIAPLAAKAWITRLLFSRLHTANECRECQITADGHVLHDLRLEPGPARSLSLKHGQGRMLVLQA